MADSSTVQVNVVDASGKARGTLDLDAAVFGAPIHGALLHQAVVRELNGQRAGTHDTKGRSEVSGGGKKPWKQKGTGRARQGSIRATQWKGGGKPFGPTPRKYGQAMPRQARWPSCQAAVITGSTVAVARRDARLAGRRSRDARIARSGVDSQACGDELCGVRRR